jgi:hypothetical protein
VAPSTNNLKRTSLGKILLREGLNSKASETLKKIASGSDGTHKNTTSI